MTEQADRVRRLNLGAGPHWARPGWEVIDHKTRTSRSASRTGYPPATFDLVFSSHMLEHVSHFAISDVLREINRILKPGGRARLLCPDLERIARIYVERDSEALRHLIAEDPTLRLDLGFGGVLVNSIVSPGQDQFLFDRHGRFVGGYAHIYGYDYEMLARLLGQAGFGDVRRAGFCESEIEDFREPLHLAYRPPVWKPEAEWDEDASLPRVTTGFDRDPFHSLIVEAVKVGPPATTPDVYGSGSPRRRPDVIPVSFRFDRRVAAARLTKAVFALAHRALPPRCRSLLTTLLPRLGSRVQRMPLS